MVIVLGVGVALAALGGTGDVFDPDVGFVDTTEEPVPVDPRPVSPDGHPADDEFVWPMFGYSKARTHHLPLRRTPRPPYRQAWALRGSVLLEFSPVLCGRRLYLLKNNGALYAVSRTSGRVSWKRKLGTLAASSPACGHGTIYSVLLERKRRRKAGRVVAVSARTGRTRWSRKLPSRAESSPLLDRNRLYFGTENGSVYSLHAGNGKVRWKRKASGAVKGALALDSGKLYFGDYGGRVHAIRRSDGGKVWTAKPGGGPLGLRESNFYSSAAVAYGRVYIGSTNGSVYSFSSSNGKLAWAKKTRGFVYASPAVGRVGKGRPTVYIGSYDGRFYALDARSGRPRWVRHLGQKISGTATIIGDIVFVTDLDKRTTWALGTGTGKTLWKTRRGAFHPAISDGRRVYFTAYSSLFALDPKGRPFGGRRTARRVAREKRAEKRRKAAERAAARRKRQRKYQTIPHGHRHSRKLGYRDSCHRHRHVYKVGTKTIVLRHNHCHSHSRRR